ncbi:MAG: hypothetical protein Q8N54_09745 [Sulfurimicrobium sp.]|nr:hypothetical protein [Sulfurimicrobium sp.]
METGLSFIQAAQILEGDTQIVVSFGVIRINLQRLTETGFGFVQAAQFLEDGAQIVVCFGAIRFDL